MKSNYNDIIDIILTFISDEEIRENMLISGSIVPYLISGKPSNEYHSDIYFFIKENKISSVRKKLKKLSRDYLFDIVCDSKNYINEDYGFKIKYEDTYIGIFPYEYDQNTFTIKTYRINKEEKNIYLKTKNICDVTRNMIIRQISFLKDKSIKLVSPEYIYIDKKMRERKPHNPTKETMELLNKICDESILKVLEESMSKMDINIKELKIKEKNKKLIYILVISLILLVIITYICFKK